MSRIINKLGVLVLCALIGGAAAGLQGSGYLGCAEGCRGSYCWGDNTGTKGCMETDFGCVLFYTKLCPP